MPSCALHSSPCAHQDPVNELVSEHRDMYVHIVCLVPTLQAYLSSCTTRRGVCLLMLGTCLPQCFTLEVMRCKSNAHYVQNISRSSFFSQQLVCPASVCCTRYSTGAVSYDTMYRYLGVVCDTEHLSVSTPNRSRSADDGACVCPNVMYVVRAASSLAMTAEQPQTRQAVLKQGELSSVC